MMNKTPNENLTALFLQQSILDSQADYERALNRSDFPRFDVIAITASNEHQAETFRAQLATRRLPAGTEFVVIPDRDGKRVGSGGATLSVIKYIKEKYGSLSGLRVMCLHSGGDGKRTPNYSALGKLFSPVPRVLPNGKPSTLFDEFMISTASIPGRMNEGMLLLSGDVLLLFNPLQIDFGGHGAAAISFKESAETCRNHGVFLKGEDHVVKRFLHKQSIETLNECGAVDERGNCSIDTGAVFFAPDILEDLYSLVSDDAGVEKYINSKTRLSLYGDFLYSLASDSTLDAFYNEKPEGEFCPELAEARTVIWNILNKYDLKLMNLAPAKFIHFGTTAEIMKLMSSGYAEYESIGWNNKINSSVSENAAGYNSILSNDSVIGNESYLEVSYVHDKAKIGSNSLISYTDISGVTIPDNVVLHGLKQANGKFVCRIYGINDNPKENQLFGKPLLETGLTDSENLWNAEIYPECDSIKEAVDSALNLYDIVTGDCGNIESWKRADKKSLCSGFNDADPQAIIDWSNHMQDLVKMYELVKLIESGTPVSEIKQLFKGNELTKIQKEWLEEYTGKLDLKKLADFSMAIRLYWYLGALLENDNYKALCFKTVSDAILEANKSILEFDKTARIVNDKTVVQLPLRVNWGGDWSDTPPHCLEQGGTVLNVAIKLSGQYPVEVTMIKIPEKKIVFDSRDMDIHGEFTDLEPLQDTGNPFDPFALQKACLLACGIIPFCDSDNNLTLKDILDRLGGGFEMHSEVINVPKGSGLGTSSILSAACVKAVCDFVGRDYTDDYVYDTVLTIEQIMSTGGGWQDQIGGFTNGIKLIKSAPGLKQNISTEQIEISKITKEELNDRFCLIYTGQRRLARNLLRDVVGRYVGNEPDSVYAHKEIQKTAYDMKDALESGNIDEFASLLSYHWELSIKIVSDTTNTLIEQILISIDDLIDGKFICGAGGGGFLQVILKKGVSKADLQKRLKSVFQDFPVDVWDCEFVF